MMVVKAMACILCHEAIQQTTQKVSFIKSFPCLICMPLGSACTQTMTGSLQVQLMSSAT